MVTWQSSGYWSLKGNHWVELPQNLSKGAQTHWLVPVFLIPFLFPILYVIDADMTAATPAVILQTWQWEWLLRMEKHNQLGMWISENNVELLWHHVLTHTTIASRRGWIATCNRTQNISSLRKIQGYFSQISESPTLSDLIK